MPPSFGTQIWDEMFGSFVDGMFVDTLHWPPTLLMRCRHVVGSYAG